MKSSFNFEKSVKSTILKGQTTKSDRSDQPVQKQHLTRFNIHLEFSKIQKKRKKKTKRFSQSIQKSYKNKTTQLGK